MRDWRILEQPLLSCLDRVPRWIVFSVLVTDADQKIKTVMVSFYILRVR